MTNPKLEVPTPQNSQVIFIDHQPQMAFGVHEGRPPRECKSDASGRGGRLDG
jgi:hypothetical protein